VTSLEQEPPNASPAPSSANVLTSPEKVQAPPSPPWADWITAGFTVVLGLATIALVITAIFQHFDTLDAIQATNRFAKAAETSAVENAAQTKLQTETLKQTQKIASASLILKLRDDLDGNQYAQLTTDIQNHDQNYPLLSRTDGGRGGRFRAIDIEGYIGNFEDIGYLVQDDIIIAKMAYDHFSYDIEKAWCNTDVQKIVREARKADKSAPATSDPFYSNFQKLAENYLAKESQSCKDLANQ
jgi:hypothetical protein